MKRCCNSGRRRMFLQSVSCLLLLVLCLFSTGCGSIWHYLWDRPAETEVDPDLLVIQGSGDSEDTMPVFEGAVIYTGEVHSGTDIYYVGTGSRRGRIIVIDAGHQASENQGVEPEGPGSYTMNVKMEQGAVGAHSQTAEHRLNLEVALLLRDELIKRGYSVVMIRETADVDISHMARAQIANKYNAAAYIRIQANADEDAKVSGAMTLCQSKKNPYPDCAAMYGDSRLLSEKVLSAYCDTTGMESLLVIEEDGMSGTNWSQVPTTTLGMGFLTNESNDMLMATAFFKHRAAIGIADGVDAYIGLVEQREENETRSPEGETTSTADRETLPAVDTYQETNQETNAFDAVTDGEESREAEATEQEALTTQPVEETVCADETVVVEEDTDETEMTDTNAETDISTETDITYDTDGEESVEESQTSVMDGVEDATGDEDSQTEADESVTDEISAGETVTDPIEETSEHDATESSQDSLPVDGLPGLPEDETASVFEAEDETEWEITSQEPLPEDPVE